MSAPAPAGPTDAQAELREVARAISDPGAVTPRAEGESVSHWSARAVLALPTVRDALAAQETLRRVEALAERFDTLGRSLHSVPAADAYDDAAVELRRALAGEA